MSNYQMEIIFSKSKPLIILTFDIDTELSVNQKWKKKFKKIDGKTYHISTTVIQNVFEKNEDILGKWECARFVEGGVEKYYGFTKIKGMEVHSLDLSKRFISDWIEEYTKLMRYTINRDNPNELPIVEECLYDAGIYSDGDVGNVTFEEVDCLRKVISPDGEIITKMRAKLNENK